MSFSDPLDRSGIDVCCLRKFETAQNIIAAPGSRRVYQCDTPSLSNHNNTKSFRVEWVKSGLWPGRMYQLRNSLAPVPSILCIWLINIHEMYGMYAHPTVDLELRICIGARFKEMGTLLSRQRYMAQLRNDSSGDFLELLRQAEIKLSFSSSNSFSSSFSFYLSCHSFCYPLTSYYLKCTSPFPSPGTNSTHYLAVPSSSLVCVWTRLVLFRIVRPAPSTLVHVLVVLRY
jgi:hypothetical protein